VRVLFVVLQGARSPGPRYRVFQFLPFYEASGLECQVVQVQGEVSTQRSLDAVNLNVLERALHYLSVWLRTQIVFLSVLRRARGFDVLYVYRVSVPAWAAFILERLRARVIFDFDDAIDLGDDGTGTLRRRLLREGVRNGIRISTTVVVSNERNAGGARSLGGTPVVVPTCVDVDRYRYRSRLNPSGRVPVVGWIGTPSTSGYLLAIEGPLLALLARIPFEIRLVGPGRNPFRRLPADVRPWTLDAEVAEITAFDIGLMPMPDTPWTSGKAALKALQYGASGAPAVVSRTEMNAEILGSDAGALLCATNNEWSAALERLLTNPVFREATGARGRERVERLFSTSRQAPRLIEVIRAAADGVA
jgi:glycosyltransferase involved in cell wall biosynthesis